MKAGRPTYRVTAKWVSFQGPNEEMFFELDRKGELIKVNKSIKPHHMQKYISAEQDVESIPLSIPAVSADPLPVIPQQIQAPQPSVDLAQAFHEMDVYFTYQQPPEEDASYFLEFEVF